MLEKVMEFAQSGNGRRLLNTLNKRNVFLDSSDLDTVLRTYCSTGLPKELETLKNRRGILRADQYNALAQAVKENGCSEKYDGFVVALRKLLSSGMRMNPTKTDIE